MALTSSLLPLLFLNDKDRAVVVSITLLTANILLTTILLSIIITDFIKILDHEAVWITARVEWVQVGSFFYDNVLDVGLVTATYKISNHILHILINVNIILDVSLRHSIFISLFNILGILVLTILRSRHIIDGSEIASRIETTLRIKSKLRQFLYMFLLAFVLASYTDSSIHILLVTLSIL